MVLALLVAVVETGEKVKPLEAKSILVSLAVIAVVCAAILLAGFGYFSASSDTNSHS